MVGENLTYRLRKEVYKKLVRMPVSYYDLTENNPGALASKLTTDAKLIQSLTTENFGLLLQNIGSCFTGLFIGFYYSWKISLVMIGLSPVLILIGIAGAKRH